MDNENSPQPTGYRVAGSPGTSFETLNSLPGSEESTENIKSVAQRADELLLAERFAEAEQLYRELIQGLEVLLGPEHADVAEAKHKLAAALGGQGRTAEAIENEENAKIIKAALQ